MHSPAYLLCYAVQLRPEVPVLIIADKQGL